jgi:hypothetical protein
MTVLKPVVFIGWLLTGITSFAICCGWPMAGSSPAMTEAEIRPWRRRRSAYDGHGGGGDPALAEAEIRMESRFQRRWYKVPLHATKRDRVTTTFFCHRVETERRH